MGNIQIYNFSRFENRQNWPIFDLFWGTFSSIFDTFDFTVPAVIRTVLEEFFDRFCFLIAQTEALAPRVRLPHSRVFLSKNFTDIF